ncbi:MAG: hypothetical protein ACYTGX_18970, partial [Planctomycetota bacterium]|jgi:hypothetical protein
VAAALKVVWAEQLGLIVEVDQVDARTLHTRVAAGEFDLALAGHFEPLPHPLGFLTSPALAWIWRADPSLREVLHRLRGLPPAESLRAFAELERTLVREAGLVTPLTRTHMTGVIAPRIRGLTPNVLDEHRLRYLRVETGK